MAESRTDRLDDLIESFRQHQRDDRMDFGALRDSMTADKTEAVATLAALKTEVRILMSVVGAVGAAVGVPVVAFVVTHWKQ